MSGLEDLQDAIENAQYLNETRSKNPKPTRHFIKPTPLEVDVALKSLIASNPLALELEGVCESCLGFYMFVKFIKERGDPMIGEFLLDIAAYKVIVSKNIFESAKRIYDTYISDNPTSQTEMSTEDREFYNPRRSRPTDLNLQFSSFTTPESQMSYFWQQYMIPKPGMTFPKFVAPPPTPARKASINTGAMMLAGQHHPTLSISVSSEVSESMYQPLTSQPLSLPANQSSSSPQSPTNNNNNNQTSSNPSPTQTQSSLRLSLQQQQLQQQQQQQQQLQFTGGSGPPFENTLSSSSEDRSPHIEMPQLSRKFPSFRLEAVDSPPNTGVYEPTFPSPSLPPIQQSFDHEKATQNDSHKEPSDRLSTTVPSSPINHPPTSTPDFASPSNHPFSSLHSQVSFPPSTVPSSVSSASSQVSPSRIFPTILEVRGGESRSESVATVNASTRYPNSNNNNYNNSNNSNNSTPQLPLNMNTSNNNSSNNNNNNSSNNNNNNNNSLHSTNNSIIINNNNNNNINHNNNNNNNIYSGDVNHNTISSSSSSNNNNRSSASLPLSKHPTYPNGNTNTFNSKHNNNHNNNHNNHNNNTNKLSSSMPIINSSAPLFVSSASVSPSSPSPLPSNNQHQHPSVSFQSSHPIAPATTTTTTNNNNNNNNTSNNNHTSSHPPPPHSPSPHPPPTTMTPTTALNFLLGMKGLGVNSDSNSHRSVSSHSTSSNGASNGFPTFNSNVHPLLNNMNNNNQNNSVSSSSSLFFTYSKENSLLSSHSHPKINAIRVFGLPVQRVKDKLEIISSSSPLSPIVSSVPSSSTAHHFISHSSSASSSSSSSFFSRNKNNNNNHNNNHHNPTTKSKTDKTTTSKNTHHHHPPSSSTTPNYLSNAYGSVPIHSFGMGGSSGSGIGGISKRIALSSSEKSLTSRFLSEEERKHVNVNTFDEILEIIYYYIKYIYFQDFKHSDMWKKYLEYLTMGLKPVTEIDFDLFRVMGRGGFGMVHACKRGMTGKLYAMKILNKKRVKFKNREQLCLNERLILAKVDSAYIVCLRYAFTNADDMFLVLDLMTGGDLGYHLNRRGRFSERESRYFTARIVMALACLHSHNIVYRDLKPENILLADDGRSKISDLGLSCEVSKNGISGCCGTRGYWAPEMIRRNPETGRRMKYNVCVDWFSLGVVAYEFHCGFSPFRSERARNWGPGPKLDKSDKDKAMDLAILEMEPEYDKIFFGSDLVIDFISKLLIKDPTQRLGAKGASEVMEHPYFEFINWPCLDSMPPPLVPEFDTNMATQKEIGDFDDTELKTVVIDEKDQKLYDKWPYNSPRAFEQEIVEYIMEEEENGPISIQSSSTCCAMC